MIPHTASLISLDGDYKLDVNHWLVIAKADNLLPPFKPLKVTQKSIAAYGITGKSTEIELPKAITWLKDISPEAKENDFSIVRGTRVYAQSELLDIAEAPISEILEDGVSSPLELDGLYEGLESGRWVIVSGERVDIKGTSGVQGSELAMLAAVWQDYASLADGSPLPGDQLHTFIQLATQLSYQYKRDTVRINANVVVATHGETRREVLGSGNGATALQSFTLKQPPLTHVAASNPTGTDSTLKVYVNDLLWQETATLLGLKPTEHRFVTKTDDEYKTTLTFGNGWQGARLPTGIENIRAIYRNGIGKAGNLASGKISQLVHRELGVKEVINPLPATGGADHDSIELIRKNAPLAVKALDRLVSVQDYEDFTRIFAGIGKALAVEVSDGQQQLVHITIAGVDNARIDKNSAVYSSLLEALHQAGDPWQPIKIDIRELQFIVLQASIHIYPEYQWEIVEKQIRATLLQTFSFERRELGQHVLRSEVISVIQAVRGVDYIDVDVFGGIPELQNRENLTPEAVSDIVQGITGNLSLERLVVQVPNSSEMYPAEIAFFTPEVPATLILNPIS